MEKIYKNLSIDNLMKTELLKDFVGYQRYEILDGLRNNLDVLIYAKKEFDNWQ